MADDDGRTSRLWCAHRRVRFGVTTLLVLLVAAGVTPAPVQAGGPGEPTGVSCRPTRTRAVGDVPWPQLRLAPDQVWPVSRGLGVTVAVIDLPINTALPQLAGVATPGLMIGTGTATGPPGCPDHGTAVAALLAGRPGHGRGLVGIAPRATILPITVDLSGGRFDPVQVAAGIVAAVRSGARIVMVAGPVDLTDERIRAAAEAATTRDVGLVVGADPALPAAPARPGVLRVAAAAADDSQAFGYPADAVDVYAPGVAVTTVNARGELVEATGTDFAVPFVAGLLALVLSAAPGISARDAVDRIRASAERSPSGTPDAGMIDVAAAVLARPGQPARSATVPSALDAQHTLLWAAGTVVLAVGWMTLRRRLVQKVADLPTQPAASPQVASRDALPAPRQNRRVGSYGP